MGALLGGLASLLYGVGDFLGGEGAKRAPAASIVLWAGVISFPIVAVVAFLVGGSATRSDLLLGVAAGACGGVGLVFLFAGLGRGQAAAVAPASAAFSGVFPVMVALFTGERPSFLVWVGVALAVPAIVLSSWVAEPGDVRLGGLWYGVAAGLGFGGYVVAIGGTSESSELLPLITARASTMAVVVLISVLGLWRVTGFRRVPNAIVIGNGLLDVCGNIALLTALRVGSLATVGVTASFFPAVTVAMARVINKEHLRGRQVVGLILTIAALGAITVG
ncbi:MAG: DMT family transporter [Acidimicrobiia bacterium]